MNNKINNSLTVHENIVMPNAELPVIFHELSNNTKGPYVVLHWHSQIEMVYVIKGTLSLTCNSEVINAKQNDFIFINSNEPHSYFINNAPVELLCCTIDISMLKGRYITSYDPEFITSFILFNKIIRDDSEIVTCFLSMWKEYKNKGEGYEFLVKAYFYSIIGQMIRNHIKSKISNQQYLHKSKNLEYINEVIKYIESHYSEDITLNDLANYINYNRYYFCRVFKQITGMPPIKFINNYRIHRAMTLMHQSSLSISQILINVGFNNHNYFSKIFKEITNETPSEYIKRINNGSISNS